MDSLQNAQEQLNQTNQAVDTGFQFATEQAERKAEEKSQPSATKEALTRFADLTGGGLVERSGEHLIKRGVRLGRDKLTKLGINPDEFEEMSKAYGKGGSKELVNHLISKYGIKTKTKLNSFINGFRDKMDNMKSTAGETATNTRQATQSSLNDTINKLQQDCS